MPKSAHPAMRPLERSLPLKLLRAREAVMDRFRPHLAAHAVTEQQWRVLRALAEVGELDASTLAEITCLLPPSLSRILHDLEARGLVERRRPEGDRRTSLISLSRPGRTLFETMSRHSEAIYRDLEARLAEAGCSDVLAVLDRLIDALAPAGPDTKPEQKPEPRSEKV